VGGFTGEVGIFGGAGFPKPINFRTEMGAPFEGGRRKVSRRNHSCSQLGGGFGGREIKGGAPQWQEELEESQGSSGEGSSEITGKKPSKGWGGGEFRGGGAQTPGQTCPYGLWKRYPSGIFGCCGYLCCLNEALNTTSGGLRGFVGQPGGAMPRTVGTTRRRSSDISGEDEVVDLLGATRTQFNRKAIRGVNK